MWHCVISVASVWTDRRPYLHLWDVISWISNVYAGSAGSGSDIHNPVCVCSVASTCNRISAGMSPAITWILHNCDSAR